MARNYPVRHNKSTSPIVLTDASLVDAGGGEHTVSDASRVAKAGDTMTGGLTLSNGANLTLSGADALGEGNIIMAAAASAAFDTNLVISDSSAKTMGYVCGPTAAFVGTSGPFFGLRGNTYAAYANQRGNIFFFGGRPTAPGANEGRVIFGTNDTERMYITFAGLIVLANATISDLASGRVVVTSTGGRCASDAGLTWASSTLGATKLQVGGGTALTKAVVYTPTLAPANVSASDEYNEQYFTVTGLSTSDTVIVNPPAMSATPHSQMICARVSAANTLAITFRAVSGTHAPPQGVYRVLAIRS